jgi:tripartite ATP-independent periplasmic transporter solute receptor, DctP family
MALFANGSSEDNGSKIIIKATTSHSSATESPEITYLTILKETLESKTNGRVQFDIYPSEQLGNQTEMVQGVQGGTIEIASFNYAILNSYFPKTMIATCPGAFSDASEVNAIMNGEYGKKLHGEMEKETGIKVLSALCNGFRCFTSNKPLSTVATAKGQKFRCMQNNISVKMVESLGALATPMASGEMYTAMQNGTVDGQENPIANIINDKTYEVQKYMVLDNHMASICGVIINSKFYNDLPDDVRVILDEAVEKAAAEAEKMYARMDVEGLETLKNYGMEIYTPTPDELKAWQTPISNACMVFVTEQLGKDVVAEFQNAVSTYRVKK